MLSVLGIWIFFMRSFATEPATCSPQGQPVCSREDNTDYFGNDLPAVYPPSLDACCEACFNTIGCTAFTYYQPWTTCYLKTSSAGRRGQAGYTSGILYPRDNATLVVNDLKMKFPSGPLLAGSKVVIVWSGGKPLPVDLYLLDSVRWRNALKIVGNFPNTGSYEWTVPLLNSTCDSKYQITIRHTGLTGPSVYGPEFVLKCRDPGFLPNILAPNKTVGHVYTDTWIVRITIASPDGYPKEVLGVFHAEELQPVNEGNHTSPVDDILNVPFKPLPGPEVRIRKGDWINITVKNHIHEEISIHWHGLHMKDQVWMDGTHGVTQCGIPPGGSFTYYFQVNQDPGTFWWHSHSPDQFGDGLSGSFIVLPEEGAIDPINAWRPYIQDIVFFLHDWQHETYHGIRSKYTSLPGEYEGYFPDYPWPSHNVLMNFRGQFDCKFTTEEDCIEIRKFGWHWYEGTGPALPCRDPGQGFNGQCQPERPPFFGICINTTNSSYENLLCSPGENIRLRLINSGASIPLRFWIDRHNLTIVAKDGVDVVPSGPHTAVLVALGQRLDVILTCDQSPQYIYYMYAALAMEFYPGAENRQPQRYSYGLVYYSPDQTPADRIPPLFPASRWPLSNENFSSYGERNKSYLPMFNDFNLTPAVNHMLPPAVERMIFNVTGSGHWVDYEDVPEDVIGRRFEWWEVNGVIFEHTPLTPLLHTNYWKLPAEHSHGLPLIAKFLYVPDNPLWYEIVLVNWEGQEHPWHLHGFTKYMIGYGWLNPTTKWRTRDFKPDPKVVVDGKFVYDPAYHGIPNFDEEVSPASFSDTVTVPPKGFVVFRIRADNPGPWVVHCHMEYHIYGGMAMIFSVEDENGNYPVPPPPGDTPICGAGAIKESEYSTADQVPLIAGLTTLGGVIVLFVALVSGLGATKAVASSRYHEMLDKQA